MTSSQLSPWKIYLALLFGTFVTIEAAAFQAPAMPSVARHFGIPINLAALILLLYFLGLTVFAPIMGWLADRVGRKRVLLFGIGLFAASEFMAALSPDFIAFLVARFLQGLGVACIIPGVLAYVGHLFSEDKRGMALGTLTVAMTLGAASGGLLGGLLIDRFGWPSVYWVSGALALAGMVPVGVMVPEVKSSAARTRFDFPGAASLFVSIAALLSLPMLVGRFGIGSPYAVSALLVGIAGLALLWRSSRRSSAPVVDTAILCRRAFALPAGIYWLHMLCFSGLVYSLAFFISGRPGGSASQVGMATLFLYGASMIGAPISGRLVDRIPARSVIIVALAATLAVLGLFVTIRVETPLSVILLTLSLLGVVMGAIGPAVMKLALGAVPREKMGAGAGLFSMLRDLGNPTGSSFALAVFGSALAHQTQVAAQSRARALGIGPELDQALASAVASKGQNLAPLLAEKMQALGVQPDELLRLAGIDGLSAALTSVGYLLMVMVCLTLALSLFLPRAGGAAAALTTATRRLGA